MSIHTYIHAYMHAWMHTYIHTYIHRNKHKAVVAATNVMVFLTVPLFYSTDLLTYSNTMSVIPVPLSHLISSALMAIT